MIRPSTGGRLLVFFFTALFLCSAAASAESVKPAQVSAPVHWHGQLTAYEMNGGVWRVDHTFQSNIRIKNIVGSAGISVTPVLYMADGTEYALPQVELSPAGIATVNVNNALEGAPAGIRRHVSDYGSVALRYTWHWAAAIMAEIENLDVPRSLIYIHPFVLLRRDAKQKPEKLQMDGLWWKRDPGVSGFIALTNVSDLALHTRLAVSDASK